MKQADLQKLEYKLLFAIIVAGKTARHARAAMDRLQVAIQSLTAERLWLPALREIDSHTYRHLSTVLRLARTGNYRKVERAFREVCRAHLNLQTCTIADLECIHGIGPKTARFWMLWTRPDAQCAALDVHVLRWMRRNGFPDAPKTTPSSRSRYLFWEGVFLGVADAAGLTPRQLDARIWLASNKSGVRA